MIKYSKKRLAVAITLGVAFSGCWEQAEYNGRQRPALSACDTFAAHVPAADLTAETRPGLRVTVRNDLPVIREDGVVISQTFLEGEIAASGHGGSPTAETLATAPKVYFSYQERSNRAGDKFSYLLSGRVLSESQRSYWLTPEQSQALWAAGNGAVEIGIRDSVQWRSIAFRCSGQPILLPPSTAASAPHLVVTVRARGALSYECETRLFASG